MQRFLDFIQKKEKNRSDKNVVIFVMQVGGWMSLSDELTRIPRRVIAVNFFYLSFFSSSSRFPFYLWVEKRNGKRKEKVTNTSRSIMYYAAAPPTAKQKPFLQTGWIIFYGDLRQTYCRAQPVRGNQSRDPRIVRRSTLNRSAAFVRSTPRF